MGSEGKSGSLTRTGLGAPGREDEDGARGRNTGEGRQGDGAEGIEIKATIPHHQIQEALTRFGLTENNDEERYVYFFDTPKLDLLRAGIILAGRRCATPRRPEAAVRHRFGSAIPKCMLVWIASRIVGDRLQDRSHQGHWRLHGAYLEASKEAVERAIGAGVV